MKSSDEHLADAICQRINEIIINDLKAPTPPLLYAGRLIEAAAGIADEYGESHFDLVGLLIERAMQAASKHTAFIEVVKLETAFNAPCAEL